MENERMYWVKLIQKSSTETRFSLFSFIMWTTQIECAKTYTLKQAKKLINEIPSHMGYGVLVEVA